MGMISGGSATIRGCPSTLPVRFECTRRQSRVRALAMSRAAPFLLLLPQPLLASLGADQAHDLIDIHVRVPGVQGAHRRGFPHPFPVFADARLHDRATVRRGEPQVAAGDLEARGQPLHVPLPRARQRLVEVVEVEHELALWRGEHPEVGQVRIAAQLHGDPDRGVAARSEAMISAAPR
jgi:hypothetical protein